MKYIKLLENFGPVLKRPVLYDYVKIKNDSPFYAVSKNRVFQITLWNSEDYYLTDTLLIGKDPGWTPWGECRFLTKSEMKDLEMELDVKKYNL